MNQKTCGRQRVPSLYIHLFHLPIISKQNVQTTNKLSTTSSSSPTLYDKTAQGSFNSILIDYTIVMALVKEIMGHPLISGRPSLVFSASHFKKKTQTTQFSIKPFDRRPNTSKSGVVSAISEDLVKTLRFSTTTGDRKSEEEEKAAVKFKVRAVVTVRNKNKEDFKETLFKHLDAFGDKIGRNIVLELISTELDPSKSLLFFLFLLQNRALRKTF